MHVRLFRGKNVDLTTTCLKELSFFMDKGGVRSGIRHKWTESRELKFDKLITR
jgi:hypothetical protein